MAQNGMDKLTKRCIEACTNTHDICESTTAYCLSMGGKHVEQEHFRLMLDCIDMCRVSSDLMLAQSQFASDICGVCADVCDSCAESCEAFGGDRDMQACARSCRTSAKLCRQMASKEFRAAA